MTKKYINSDLNKYHFMSGNEVELSLDDIKELIELDKDVRNLIEKEYLLDFNENIADPNEIKNKTMELPMVEKDPEEEYEKVFKICNKSLVLSDHILEIGERTKETIGYIKLGLPDELIDTMVNQAKENKQIPIQFMMLSWRDTRVLKDGDIEDANKAIGKIN